MGMHILWSACVSYTARGLQHQPHLATWTRCHVTRMSTKFKVRRHHGVKPRCCGAPIGELLNGADCTTSQPLAGHSQCSLVSTLINIYMFPLCCFCLTASLEVGRDMTADRTQLPFNKRIANSGVFWVCDWWKRYHQIYLVVWDHSVPA